MCKEEFTELHFFYDTMCKKCGDLNYRKRFQTAPLHGQVALITGARVKIGYQATLMMLRAGATVIATTRFPVDAALRYSREEGYAEWGDRLHIHGLDLRHIPSVEIFTRYVEQRHGRLDILINNAAQTVRRPPGFYAHLIENEKNGFERLAQRGAAASRRTMRRAKNSLCPSVMLPKSRTPPFLLHGMTRDPASACANPRSYRRSLIVMMILWCPRNCSRKGSWMPIFNRWICARPTAGVCGWEKYQTTEMLEVQLVNAVAPFVLCNRLVSLMRRDYTGQKHIVNVTAMEGKFFRFKKDDRHPHTNMAKAALNMMTHTSAEDLAKDGIYMNAVDTGWVTDEDPAELSQFKQKVHDFQPPLDIVDGAARVCDPFFDGILTGKHWCGKFLKDYFPIDW